MRSFTAELAMASLPSAVVVDVGFANAPAVVEANMAWFSHTYMSDLDRMLDVVLRSAGLTEDVSPADEGFMRHTPSRDAASRET